MAPERRTEIQWLRAIAATEVIVCHSDLLTKHFSDFRLFDTQWFQLLGGIGVELFFIVSGYVICMRAPSFASGGAFLLARIRRLYPMYWIFTDLVLLAFVIHPAWRLNNFSLDPIPLLQSYLILPQWGFPILGVGWTLEHEMMFYGFVALAMVFWSMKSSARIVVAWFLCGLGFFGAMHGPEPGPSLWAYHIFNPYMFAFGFGWLMRCIEGMEPRAQLWNVAVFAGVAATAYLVGTDVGDRLVLRITLAAVVFSAFISARGLFESNNRLNRFGWKLGDASYSVYLCHWMVLSAIGKVMGVLPPPTASAELIRVLGIALSIAIGVAIFTLIERPIDRWLRQSGPLPEFHWPRFGSLWRQGLSRLFS